MQITVLGIYVWGEGLAKPAYYTYMSTVLDHTPAYVIACLEDLFSRLPSEGVTHEVLWADIGTHFRAYRFWGYWLDHFPLARDVDIAINYHLDGRGTHMLDGHFGKLRRWSELDAKKRTISEPEEW